MFSLILGKFCYCRLISVINKSVLCHPPFLTVSFKEIYIILNCITWSYWYIKSCIVIYLFIQHYQLAFVGYSHIGHCNSIRTLS